MIRSIFKFFFFCITFFFCSSIFAQKRNNIKIKIDDEVRGQQIADMKFGMFICWSFSTFSGMEWTATADKDASFFKATGCNTDQWCQVAKDAGMHYILFLTKHHDGFCLWNTKTTQKKVTNSPLGIDVLAKLKKSCDKYGIKLALYFSEGDWNFPGAVYRKNGGKDSSIKKVQLKELLNNYGPIQYIWFDYAQGDGGLNHAETAEWVNKFQPNCFVGFNNGEKSGRLEIRERGTAGSTGDTSKLFYRNKTSSKQQHKYFVSEFTYPILPEHVGGANWFYSLPSHDTLCLPPEKIYKDYLEAVKYKNIFSLDVGPNYNGSIRAIDSTTLQAVGKMIRENEQKNSPNR